LPRNAIEGGRSVGDPRRPDEHRVRRRGVYNLMRPGPWHDALGADGKPRGARRGPISFELSNRSGIGRSASTAGVSGHGQGQIAGRSRWCRGRPRRRVRDRHVSRPAVGERFTSPRGRAVLAKQTKARDGGPRFEQLPRHRHTARRRRGHRIDGGACAFPPGNRRLGNLSRTRVESTIFRRQGLRVIVYRTRRPPATTTRATSSRATATRPGVVVTPPWLRRLVPIGEDVSVCSKRRGGRPLINAESVCRPSW